MWSILTVFHSRQRQLSQPREIHLFDGNPIGTYGDGSISDFDLWLCYKKHSPINKTSQVPFLETYASLSPPPDLALLVAVSALQALPERLHPARLGISPAPSPPHVPLVRFEPSPLIRRFLHAGGIHQMESALVFVVEVSVLTSRAELGRILI